MRKERRDLDDSEKGFTLIEVMVVIIIIGLLSALVAPKFFKKVDKAKFNTTRQQIAILGSALDDFRLDTGRYPTTAEGLSALREKPEGLDTWDGPYLPKKVPGDAWGRPFVYSSPGEHGDYDLASYGNDGQEGGENNDRDINSWE